MMVRIHIVVLSYDIMKSGRGDQSFRETQGLHLLHCHSSEDHSIMLIMFKILPILVSEKKGKYLKLVCTNFLFILYYTQIF
jgi:hypothetical protein